MNNAALGVIEKAPRIDLSERFAFRHHGREGVSAFPYLLDIGTLCGQGFRRRKSLRGVIRPLADSLKVAPLAACRELIADLGKGRLTHAAPERDCHDRPLIGNRLPLEKMVAGEGHRLLCTDWGRLANALLYGTLPRLCNDTARLVAELGGNLPMRLQYLLFGEVLFPLAGGVRGDLCGFGSFEAVPLQVFPDLCRTWAGSIKVFLRVAFDFGSSSSPTLQFVAELAELVHQVRLVHSRRVTLAFKERSLLKSTGGAVLPFGYVEDNGMGVKLWRGITVRRAGRIVFELGRDKPPGLLGRVVAADPGLRVLLQLGKRSGHRFPVSQAHALIAAHQCGQRHGLGRGEGGIPTGTVLHRLRDGAIRVDLFTRDAMPHHLLACLRMLTSGESHEVGFADSP
jgi:hypothetical protein